MILFQCAHGPCKELAELSREHHARLLPQAHIVIESEYHPAYQRGTHGGWNKLLWLSRLMESCVNGKEILCLDADAVVVRAFAFIDALPYESDFAAVKNQRGAYNTGAMFWRNSPSVREIIKRALSVGPIGNGHEQKTLNMFLSGLRCRQLPREWNDYQWAMGAHTSPTIIRAWHGEPRDNANRGIREEVSRAA